MRPLTREQQRRRAQMLRAHYEDERERHDWTSPKEWQKQAFRLQIKTTLFHTAFNIIITSALAIALFVLIYWISHGGTNTIHTWMTHLLK